MSEMGHIICLNDAESNIAKVTTGVDSFDAIQKYLRGHRNTDIRVVHVICAWKIIYRT